MRSLPASEIDRLCAENKRVWVQNMTKSIILISVPNHCLRLPASEEPICITDFVSTEIVKQLPDLRRLISSGTLKLLNPNSRELKGLSSAPLLSNLAEASKRTDEAVKDNGRIIGGGDAWISTRIPKTTPVSMKLSQSQMKDLANEFADMAHTDEISSRVNAAYTLLPPNPTFPTSVYDEWFSQAADGFEEVAPDEKDVAEIAASLILGEIEVKKLERVAQKAL